MPRLTRWRVHRLSPGVWEVVKSLGPIPLGVWQFPDWDGAVRHALCAQIGLRPGARG